MANSKTWSKLKYFTINEKWGNPDKMDSRLLFELDAWRDYIKMPVVIHCGYEDRGGSSYHNAGMAADCHVVGMDLVDVFLSAMRFGFTGIGVYDKNIWNNPGVHLDVRKERTRAIWGCTKLKGSRMYLPLDRRFIGSLLE